MDSHKGQTVLELSASLSLRYYATRPSRFSYTEFLYSTGGLMYFCKLGVCKGHTNGCWYNRVLIVYVAQLWLPSHIQRGSFSLLIPGRVLSLNGWLLLHPSSSSRPRDSSSQRCHSVAWFALGQTAFAVEKVMKCLKPEEVLDFMEEYQKLSAVCLHVPLRDTLLFPV